MNILLMRHLESTKNINKSFSSSNNMEELTSDAINKGKILAKQMQLFIEQNNYIVNNIYCAKSERGLQTATLFATTLGAKVVECENLISTKSGVLRGKTEKEAQNICPQYVKELALFRAGIFSAYDFSEVPDKENKEIFEYRVVTELKNIINNTEKEDLKVIVLHHSSLTAAVIYFARKCLNYPKNHYGLVVADYGNVYWINEQNGKYIFLAANCSISDLIQ